MKNTRNSFPVATILTLIFITLKLTNHIQWSWVWVLSPVWIALSVGVICLLIFGFIVRAEVKGEIRRRPRA